MNKEKQQYSLGFILSVIIHGILIALLFLSIKAGVNSELLPAPKGDIVQAVMVDEKKVQAEVQRLESIEKQQRVEEEKRKQDLIEKSAAAKREREQEQAKLEKLKQELAKAKQEEENRLAEIKLAKEKEQKQLEELRQKKIKEEKSLAALDDQRQAEQDRVQQMRIEREKEEKRQQSLQKQADAKRKQAEAKQQASLQAKQVAAEKQKRIMTEAERILNEWATLVRNNKREAFELPPDLFCTLLVSLMPDGSVLEVKLLKSSGNSVYDDLTIHAVYKTAPFEMPGDPLVRDQVKSFELGVRNVEESA